MIIKVKELYMPEKPEPTLKSTKQEILEAYEAVKKELEEKEKQSLNATKKLEEKKKTETVEKTDSLIKDGISEKINQFKTDIIKSLEDLSLRLSKAESDYLSLKEAISLKNKEIKEIYDIDTSALTLASLIEAHNRKTHELESDYAAKKKQLESELEFLRNTIEQEKKAYEKMSKEKEIEFKLYWDRKKEEFEYNFKRDSDQKLNELNDQLKKLKQTIEEEKSKFDKEKQSKSQELEEREKKVAEKERYTLELEEKVESFPSRLQKEVQDAIKETTQNLQSEFSLQKAIIQKEYEGKINVLNAKIESLEKIIANQERHIETLTSQHEKAYLQVQQIATSAIESNIDKNAQSKFELILDKISKIQNTDK
jgi:hypothetical protein